MSLVCSLQASSARSEGIQPEDVVVYATLVSDYVFRGFSQTREKPAVQLGVELDHPSGVFAGLWASNVEFPRAGPIEDRRDVELDLYVGYGRSLGGTWAASASVSRYEYPGGGDEIDWDYTEFGVALHRENAALAASYSDSAFGSGAEGLAIELSDRWMLPKGVELTAGVGFSDLEAVFLEDYVYWNLGVSRPFKRVEPTLEYFDTDPRGEDNWGTRARARLVVGVSYRLH